MSSEKLSCAGHTRCIWLEGVSESEVNALAVFGIMFIALSGDSKISLALRAKSPIGPAPVTVGAGLEAGWIQKWTNGVYECGISDHPKKRPFTVLLTLLQSPAQSFFDWLFSPRNPTPPQTKEGIPFGSGTAVEHK